MAQITTLKPNALPGQMYGSFAGKTPYIPTPIVTIVPHQNIPSRHQSLALPILVSDPLWQNPRRGYIDTLTRDIADYQHSTHNARGYDKMSFNLNVNLDVAEDWILRGLGRHMVVKDENLVVIWEGFVNKIGFRVGAIIIIVGPILEVSNRVRVVFSTIDTSTDPPTVGSRIFTTRAVDTLSQSIYGIRETILSQGGTTSDLAEQVRDKYLEENKNPPRSSEDNFAQINQPSVQVNCLGYYYLLNSYTYRNTGTGDQNLSDKMEAIISDEPNSILSTDFSGITTNTTQVNVSERERPRAKTLIEELVGLGDSSFTRYNFMVLKDRKVLYQPIPETIEYVLKVTDRGRIIEDVVGNRVRPWAVLPGRWRKIPDIFVGRSNPGNLRDDLRMSFITKTTFRAPNDLRLSGEEVEELPQMIGRISGGVQVGG